MQMWHVDEMQYEYGYMHPRYVGRPLDCHACVLEYELATCGRECRESNGAKATVAAFQSWRAVETSGNDILDRTSGIWLQWGGHGAMRAAVVCHFP